MADAANICAMCNEPAMAVCTRCCSIKYCSKNCQKVDWPIHKPLCCAFSTFGVDKRPSEDHVIALLFPQDKTKPQLIWLHCPWQRDIEDNPTRQLPEYKELIGENDLIGVSSLQFDTLLDREIYDTISVLYRENFLADGSKFNESISHLKPAGVGHHWCGPVIAYVGRGSDDHPRAMRDVNLGDYRHVVDFFLTFSTMGGPAHDGRFRGKTIKGVKVNCDGDVRLLGTTTYEAVDVPPTHPIFYDHDEPSIAKHIGLSVLTRKCEPNPIWAKGSSMGFYDNQPVTFLHMDCDLNTMSVPGWGWAPNKWQNKVGSVLIVRKDCKPLLPLHAAALCNYCQTYLQPRFEKAVEATGPNMMATRTNFLARITRENFELCWKETLENKDVYGSNMDAPNPYDVD